MKALIIATIISLSATCYAGEDWVLVDYSYEQNFRMEIDKSSIERMDSSTVITNLRNVRLVPEVKDWAFFEWAKAVEYKVKIDCIRHKSKTLSATSISLKGERNGYASPSLEYTDIIKGSMMDAVLKVACEPKIK